MTDDALDRQWYEVGMALKLSAHYHQERKRFFVAWDNLATLSGVLFSSSAAIALWHDSSSGQSIALYLAFGVAVVQGFALVIGFSRKAWTHSDFCRRFIDLEQSWINSSMSTAAYRDIQTRRRELEKDEPTPMPYLVQRCHIDIMRREGFPRTKWPKLGLFKRTFAQYLPELG